MDQLRGLYRGYIRQYNLKFHTGIQCTPMERYEKSEEGGYAVKSKEWLDECFLNRITRKVRKDSTVTIDNVLYDAPMECIGQKLEIRYVPSDMSTAFFLLPDGKHYPLRKTNKVENCHTPRKNNTLALDYTKMEVGSHE